VHSRQGVRAFAVPHRAAVADVHQMRNVQLRRDQPVRGRSIPRDAPRRLGVRARRVLHLRRWASSPSSPARVPDLARAAGMFGTLGALFALHRRERDAARAARVAYWQEQAELREGLLGLRDAARASADRGERKPVAAYGRGHAHTRSDDSRAPILARAGSPLRHAYADDGDTASVSDAGYPSMMLEVKYDAHGKY
jgi:hypothetical protein